MHISSCLHPVKVYPFGKDYDPIMVPCGKCLSCRAIKRSNWAKRLEAESLDHRYVIFLTLTYSDSMVPKVVKTEDGNLVDPVTGEYFDIKTYFYDEFYKKDFASGQIVEKKNKEIDYYKRYSTFNVVRLSPI